MSGTYVRIRREFAGGPPRAYERISPNHKYYERAVKSGLVLAQDEQGRDALFTPDEWNTLRPVRKRLK